VISRLGTAVAKSDLLGAGDKPDKRFGRLHLQVNDAGPDQVDSLADFEYPVSDGRDAMPKYVGTETAVIVGIALTICVVKVGSFGSDKSVRLAEFSTGTQVSSGQNPLSTIIECEIEIS
jgi:hypothetical protein